eukprot:11089151-Lingulodinium_polyedra.AAC.1
MRVPVFWRARGVRFASRSGDGWSIRQRRCAAIAKRCATMQSNRRFASAAARESHVCALHALT